MADGKEQPVIASNDQEKVEEPAQKDAAVSERPQYKRMKSSLNILESPGRIIELP